MKTNKVVFIIFSLFAYTAGADLKGTDASQFIPTVKSFAQACPANVNCPEPLNKVKIFSIANKKVLAHSSTQDDVYKILSDIAIEQAQIWGDTILEGDYYADGDTRLDEIETLYEGKEFLGYRITYSERAWDTSECRYDGRNPETLNGCVEGRIVESSFVSPQFSTYIRDANQFAEFKANE